MQHALVTGSNGVNLMEAKEIPVLNNGAAAIPAGGLDVLDFQNGSPNEYGAATSGFYRVAQPNNVSSGFNTVRYGIVVVRDLVKYSTNIPTQQTGRMAIAGRVKMTVTATPTPDVLPGNPVFMQHNNRKGQAVTSGLGSAFISKVFGILLETHLGGGDQSVFVLIDGINGFGTVTTST